MLICDALPSTIEVGGVLLPICTGFRRHLAAETLDRENPDAGIKLLWLYMAKRGNGGARQLPEEVHEDPAAWLEAAMAWHDQALSALDYGDPLAPKGSGTTRVFDWEADEGIICCDFQRFYGIDIADPATQMHWWRFCTLLMGLVRTDGALVSAAIAARSPLPANAPKELKKAHRAQAAAWALPPTEDELRARLAKTF